MTHERDMERLLDSWFNDGPDQAPDRVIDVVTDRIGHQRQRPAWRLDWRHTTMTPTVKFGAAIAAVVLIALVGFGMLRGGSSNVGVPVATPSPTASPQLSASPSVAAYECGYGDLGATGCAGILSAGEHRSRAFQPVLTYQTPAGWENRLDIPAWFELSDGDQTMIIWSEVVAAYQNSDCLVGQKIGFGGSVQDWMDYLTSHPGLVATDPVPVTLGAARGQSTDISVATDWGLGCIDNAAGSGQNVMLFTQAAGAEQEVAYGLLAPERMRVVALDVGGRTIVIAAYGGSGSFDSATADAQPIIDSMRFTP